MINDISKAIGFFESIIQDRDRISADTGTELTAKLAEHKEHLAVAVDSMLLILSDPETALRLSKQAGNQQ